MKHILTRNASLLLSSRNRNWLSLSRGTQDIEAGTGVLQISSILQICLWNALGNEKYFKRIFYGKQIIFEKFRTICSPLEQRQNKNDSIQSKIIPILKLPLFSPHLIGGEKARQFQS